MSTIKPIKTEADYDQAGDRVYQLMHIDDDKHTESMSDELEILVTLMDNYQEKHHAFADPDPLDVIEFYMDQNGISRSDLVPCKGSKKKVSQVLAGTQPLSFKMIRALEEQFDIPSELLLDRTKFKLPKSDLNIDWNKFPVADLAKNDFLKDRRDPKDYSEELMRELISDAGGEEAIAPALFAKVTPFVRTPKWMLMP